MTRRPGPAIPNFNLFGEAGDLPDVVHCETIEARSRLHDWDLAPHRHARLHQVLVLEAGGGEASMDGSALPLGPMTAVNVPIGMVHGFSFLPGTQGHVVTLAAEALDEALRPGEGLREVLARPAVLPASEAIVASTAAIAGAFVRRDFARAHVLRSLSALLLGQIAQAVAAAGGAGEAAAPELLAAFNALLERHFLDHWGVGRYARALAVTPAHLSRVARAATGLPASRLIEERMVREARRHLVYTSLPVSKVAYALGYEDPAYFSRVFSRATGLAPSAFRARARGGS